MNLGGSDQAAILLLEQYYETAPRTKHILSSKSDEHRETRGRPTGTRCDVPSMSAALVAGQSLAQVGRDHSIHFSYVQKLVKAYRIELNLPAIQKKPRGRSFIGISPRIQLRVPEIAELHLQKFTATNIGHQLGLSHSTVIRVIKTLGV